jgi:hypothetical protein
LVFVILNDVEGEEKEKAQENYQGQECQPVVVTITHKRNVEFTV